jgi:type II secretory pathway pseudopilin PulG
MQRATVANILAVLAIVAIACSAAIPYTAGQISKAATTTSR